MKKVLALIGLLTCVAAFTPQKAEAQATNVIQQNIDQSVGNFTFKSVTIVPSQTENPTNSFKVIDSYNTNAFMISPTNVQPIIYANGTNSVGQDADVIFTNAAGTTRHLIFKRGILVNGSTF